MAQYKAMALVEFGKDLQELSFEMPVPKGTEVLIKVQYGGLCHSELHLAEGYLDAGDGKKVKMGGQSLPSVIGHEIEGMVQAKGSDVPDNIPIGKSYAVFPWIGCDRTTGDNVCPYCLPGMTNLCSDKDSKRFIDGASRYGGYGSHVLVPHYKWLLDVSGFLKPGLGAIYMCSGLTAFSGLKKVLPIPTGKPEDVLIVGLGGLGLQALHLGRALFGGWPMCCDIDDAKLEEARSHGATHCFNSKDPTACIDAIRKTTLGGVGCYAALNFVGNEPTMELCKRVVRSGGQIVTIGLMGGKFSLALPAMVGQMRQFRGSMVGNFAEATEMLELVKKSGCEPPPHHYRSIREVNQAMEDLRQGKYVGRCILKHDWDGDVPKL